jgi:predicted secreted protein
MSDVEETNISPGPSLDSEENVDRYVGTLPCKDCDGIRTDLRLFTNSAGEPASFELNELYLGTPEGDRSYTTKGRWKILRGSPADPNATIYEFDSDPTGRMSFLVLEKKYELRLLSQSRAELDIAVPHSLTRIGRDAVDPIVLTPEASGREIELRKDQLLVVRLSSNPSTGFRWALTDSTEKVVELQGDSDYVPDSIGASLGSGGTEIWRFKAIREGEQSLSFVYRRADESAPGDKTIALKVKVL